MLGLFSMTRREGLGDETSSKSGRVRVEAKPTVEDLRPGSKRSIFRSGLEEEHLSVRTNQARACGLLVGIRIRTQVDSATRQRQRPHRKEERRQSRAKRSMHRAECYSAECVHGRACSVGVRAFVVLERRSSPPPVADRRRPGESRISHASSVLQTAPGILPL
jgi:hypothetical protein